MSLDEIVAEYKQRRAEKQVPYIGPADLLRRFLDGEIVTRREAVTDESEWIHTSIHVEQRRRMANMLDLPIGADSTDVMHAASGIDPT